MSTGGTGASWNLTNGVAQLMMLSHSSGTTAAISAGVHVFFGACWARLLSTADIEQMHNDPFVICRG